MTRKRILVTLLAIAVVVLIVWQFHHSPEWKRFSWNAVWTATQQARGGLVLASVVLIYASYLIRTWRWQTLMSPPGRFWPIFKGTAVGFTGTALLGRPGELVRPYYIARKHGSEFSPQLAVWLLERMFDMAGVVLLVGLDLALDPRIVALTKSVGYADAFRKAGILISVGMVVLLGALYLFHLRADGILAGMKRRQMQHPTRIRKRLLGFLQTLARGTSGLTRGRTMLAAVLYTVLLWVVISASIWMVVRAYPEMLPGFSFSEGILLMGLTAVGSVIQLPAVGGGFQVLTIFGLTKIFGADTAPATSAALIIWLVCFYAIAPLGAGFSAHEGVSWRGLEKGAQQEEAAVERQAEFSD